MTHAAKYVDHCMATMSASKGALQRGFPMSTMGNVVAYTNRQPKQGSNSHSGGSKLTLEGAIGG